MDKYTLKLRQAMPLADKIRFTQRRLNEWVEHFGIEGVYISFSGGKDSTVLLDIARKLYPNIKAMYVDTGLEYPEIKQFVKTFDNVDIIRPKMMFNKVIEKYGYPIISKEQSQYIYDVRTTKSDKFRNMRIHGEQFAISKKWLYLLKAPFKISNKCCSIMKKNPAHKYQKDMNRKPIIATMADESMLRTQQYLKHGCNAFNNKIPTSTPMAFWTEQDVLEYLYINKINYCSVYGDIVKGDKFRTTGCKRTGCMFCGYGCHLDKYPNRFQSLAKTHPKQYDYIINQLGMGKVLNYIGVEYKPNVQNDGQMRLF